MCEYFHVFAVYSDSINSWCRLSVCGVFERALVQESRCALLHYPMSLFLYRRKTKENLRQYKFSFYNVFRVLSPLVTFLYFNDLFHMHRMLSSTIKMKRRKSVILHCGLYNNLFVNESKCRSELGNKLLYRNYFHLVLNFRMRIRSGTFAYIHRYAVDLKIFRLDVHELSVTFVTHLYSCILLILDTGISIINFVHF